LAFGEGDRPSRVRDAEYVFRELGVAHLSAIVDARGAMSSPFRRYVGLESERGQRTRVSIPRTTLVDPVGVELGRLTAASRYIPREELTPQQLRIAEASDGARWPRQEYWREPAMFEFLNALGGAAAV